jgi:hypothetical protein
MVKKLIIPNNTNIDINNISGTDSNIFFYYSRKFKFKYNAQNA